MKFLLNLLIVALTLAKCQAATRVALVADKAEGDVVKILDLATVKLGQEKEIELLSRDEIQRVLAEQQLTLDGTLNPSRLVTAGKLLKVDLFAVLDTVTRTNRTEGGMSQAVAGLTVFDAKTGVRLEDAALSEEGVEKLAEAVVAGLLAAQHKQVAAGLPTICLLSVRNADLPRSLDGLCDSVGRLLERRLLASASCAVLERQRLDQINKERALPGNEADQALLASVVIMELECSRGPDGQGLRATAWLSSNEGKLLSTFTVTS